MRTALVKALMLSLCLSAPVPTHSAFSSSLNDRPVHVVDMKTIEDQKHQFAAHETPSKIIPAGRASSNLRDAAEVHQPSPRILFGSEAEECQFPHQVALSIDSYTFCGGSLISNRWVLTAAHCIIGAYSVIVYLGSVEYRRAPLQIKVSRIFLHGDFNESFLNNDIAMLELSQEVTFTDCVKPVELEPTGCDNSLANANAVVSGWGRVSENTVDWEQNLRWVRTKVISNDICIQAYNDEVVIHSTLCSEPHDSQHNGTLCGGDSGGPLLLEETNRLIGINSFVSSRGCDAGLPSGYVRVACFSSWINYVMTL